MDNKENSENSTTPADENPSTPIPQTEQETLEELVTKKVKLEYSTLKSRVITIETHQSNNKKAIERLANQLEEEGSVMIKTLNDRVERLETEVQTLKETNNKLEETVQKINEDRKEVRGILETMEVNFLVGVDKLQKMVTDLPTVLTPTVAEHLRELKKQAKQ